MATSSRSQSRDDRLRRIESVTDVALAHLDVGELLAELLERVRDLLEVDTAAVLLLDGDGEYLVAKAARGIEEEVLQGVRIPMGQGFAGRIAAEKRPVILDRVDHTTVLNPILRERRIKSLMGVPLLSEGRVLGVLHVGTLGTRRFDEDDIHVLQLVADRIALATQAQVSETERAAALALQDSLIPARLPGVPGMEFAARYVPGGESGVGGDWYDVFELPSGALCVVIGDVVGRGLTAAIIMGRLRSAVRAYALMGDDPAEILDLVDRKLQHFEPGAMATMAMGVFDPSLEHLRISLAGHLPPILAELGQSPAQVDVPVDAPLGVRVHRRRRTTAVPLPVGAVVCFFTDGLVERRGTTIDMRLERLSEVIAPGPPDPLCALVMSRMVGMEPSPDDVAVLIARRTGLGAEPLEIEVPAVPASLARVRAALRGWLSAAGAGNEEIQDVVLAVGEATANAVEHAYGASGGTVKVIAAVEDAEVVVRVRDTGQWRAPRSQDRGRGTRIMERATDEFRFEPGPDGTQVLLRRRLGAS